MHPTICPRCADGRSTIRYDFGTHRIVRCAACSLMYLDPWPSEDDLRGVYDEQYFQNQTLLHGRNRSLYGYFDYVAERINKQADYVPIARDIRARLPHTDAPRLLEVGCGFGYFLDVAFEEGFKVAGLEFNESAVRRLREKYAFPILGGAIETVPLPAAGYDAVVMFDVIEHLRDPFAALDRLHDAIAPGGWLVITTMDSESRMSRLLGQHLEDFRRTREHLFFFSRRTLAEVLREHGFEPADVRSIGHTIELALLLDRLTLYQHRLFSALRALVCRLGLGSVSVRVDPHTKMIVFARRSG
jgi:2-polyprenyl-3-methyl-5-hydroxy-6-metoxy-1,4-benzoquinol methylase